MSPLNLTNLETYAESCRSLANENLAGLDMVQVASGEDEYNAYPHQDQLSPPQNLLYLEDYLNQSRLDNARQAVLAGHIFWEHTAAGEASRLGLGPKFLITPSQLSEYITPHPLLPLNLGVRHLAQLAFEIGCLAKEHGLNPTEVLARQKTLLIINEDSQAAVLECIWASNFMGFNPLHFFFMVQPTFHALKPSPKGWDFDQSSPRRLHNHGQMALQKTMDNQIFYFTPEGHCHYLSRLEYQNHLKITADLVSYNIEDLGYLTQALDFETLALALHLGEQNFGMAMEIVPNNPNRPTKGGGCFFDGKLNREVVIEGFRLKSQNRYPQFLNKNFNHYPNPAQALNHLYKSGLFMPIAVKDGGLYFQPVQGDLNFLVKTAFMGRRSKAPITCWKTPDDTPAALETMGRQDQQNGFCQFIADNLTASKSSKVPYDTQILRMT